jgi:hypothetical protein
MDLSAVVLLIEITSAHYSFRATVSLIAKSDNEAHI